MKVTCRITTQLLCFALIAFQFTVANANTGAPFSIRGTAAINDTVLTLDTVIKEGDIIKTGKNSSVKIIMEDRTVLDIRENTTFKVESYQYNKDAPEKSDSNKSTFNLIKGTFRYISGWMAKRRHQSVSIITGGATIGIRGSFDTVSFDGTTISVDASIGVAIITFPNGETLTITAGSTGTWNISTGQHTLTPTTIPDSVSQAVTDIASDPEDQGNVIDAVTDLNNPDTAMALAALINNKEELDIDDINVLSSILGSIVSANPSIAVALAFVASTLSPDNKDAFVNAISAAAPDQAEAIKEAGELGKEFEIAPDTDSDTGGVGAGTGGTGGVGGGGGGGGGGESVSPS